VKANLHQAPIISSENGQRNSSYLDFVPIQ
jgi:hypothetical protein